MNFIIVQDTDIVAINLGKKENESIGIVYRDNGEMHTIDFETCANNYQAEHNGASRYCIGERKFDEGYFIFYTSGIKTKIVFDKMYVGNFFSHHLFSGNRNFRFLGLWNSLNRTKYTTRDLS